ncbi:UNVERIFIED_CONTAM: Endonuclease 8-like 3 [Gekko kuhli]
MEHMETYTDKQNQFVISEEITSILAISIQDLLFSWIAAGNKISCQDVLSVLNGCVYSGVETLGKELFMYFGEQALRIHFGMNGSLRINSDARRNTSGLSSVLEIQFTADLVCFYDATLELRNAAESERKIRMLEDLDVCSPKFSFSRAKNEIKKQKDRLLCDVLLDQAVLPGVGNIIKNEALFDSGLHPGVRASQLTDEQTHHLVKMIRDFTLLFYKCRKTGLALYKHYKVYKRSSCAQCRTKITVCRLGESGRMTYFCPQCQKDKPQLVDPGMVQFLSYDLMAKLKELKLGKSKTE